MKIAEFPSSFLPNLGGAEIYVHNLAAHLQELGHDVTVITNPRNWQKVHKKLPYNSVPLIPRTYSFESPKGTYFEFKKWLLTRQLALLQRIYKFDIWHLHSMYPLGVLAASFFRSQGIPAVVVSHGGDFQRLPEVNYGKRLDGNVDRAIRMSVSAYDRFIAISESMRAEFIEAGIEHEKIRCVPIGVAVEPIMAMNCDRDKVRTKLRLPLDKFVLITVGRNHPKKGYRFIPEIIKHVTESRKDFLWVLIGRLCEPIVEQAKNLNVDEYLRVIPQIGLGDSVDHSSAFRIPNDSLIEFYRTADIFVFPSLMEASPAVHIEAMAAGLPVITTDAPGCRDATKDGVTGLISPVGDLRSMAANIIRLMSDRALRQELGRNGQADARKNQWDKVTQLYCSVFEEAIREHKLA